MGDSLDGEFAHVNPGLGRAAINRLKKEMSHRSNTQMTGHSEADKKGLLYRKQGRGPWQEKWCVGFFGFGGEMGYFCLW